MNKTALCAACTAALLSLAAGAQAADIYPVDRARFMTNARFDFKVELDQVVSRQDVRVEINGWTTAKCFRAAKSGCLRKWMLRVPHSSSATWKSRSRAATR